MSIFARAQLLLCLVVLYIKCLHSSPHVKGGVLKYSCLGRLVTLDRYAVSACFLTLEMVRCAQRMWHQPWGSGMRTKWVLIILWERALWNHYTSRLHCEWSPASPAEGGDIFYIVTFSVLNLTHFRNFEVSFQIEWVTYFWKQGAHRLVSYFL